MDIGFSEPLSERLGSEPSADAFLASVDSHLVAARHYVTERLGLVPQASNVTIMSEGESPYAGYSTYDRQDIVVRYPYKAILSGDATYVDFDVDGLVSVRPVLAHELLHTAVPLDAHITAAELAFEEGLVHYATIGYWMENGGEDMAYRLMRGLAQGFHDPLSLMERFAAFAMSLDDIDTAPEDDFLALFGHRSPGVRVGMAATLAAITQTGSLHQAFSVSHDERVMMLADMVL